MEKKERERRGFRPGETGPRYVAMLQDRNTRKLYSQAMKTKTGPEVLRTYRKLFNQVEEDAAHGKRSPVVRLGTARAAALVPWFVALTLALEWVPVLHGDLPPTVLLSVLGCPAGVQLMRLLQRHHDWPELISGSKFLALRFQGWNGLGLSAGLALARFWTGG